MTMTDPIADMLTRIRNANTAMHDQVRMPSSKLKESLAAILQAEGYIDGYNVKDSVGRPGRTLEINTRVPLPAVIVRWWYEAGGEALVFGSDAHRPKAVARRFTAAASVAEAAGFHPGRHPHDFWRRNAIR